MSFFSKKFTNFLNSFLETNEKKETEPTQIPEETNRNDELAEPETQKNDALTEEKQEEMQPIPEKVDEILLDTFKETENHIPDTTIDTPTINTIQSKVTPEQATKEKHDGETTDDTTNTLFTVSKEEREISENEPCREVSLDETAPEKEQNNNTQLDSTVPNLPDTPTNETEKPERFSPEIITKNTAGEIQEESIHNKESSGEKQTIPIMPKHRDTLSTSREDAGEGEGKDETIHHEEVKNSREIDTEKGVPPKEEREEIYQGEKNDRDVKEETSQPNGKDNQNATQPSDIEKLIEQREYLESLLKEKFTKRMTVMFTDLKGSTAIADAEGDIASRTIMKQHNDILFPIIKKNNGVLVKTMGDGTLSYFEEAQNAIRAAVEAQIGFDRYNVEKKPKTLLLVTMGLHTGQGVVEENDIFGDVVNVASRIESASNPGEIYLSEDSYNALTNKSEIYIRYIKSTTLKGKKGEFRLYKAFWDEKEIELDKFGTKEEKVVVKKRFPVVKVSMMVSIPLMITYLLMLGGVVPNPFISSTASKIEQRSISTDISDGEVKKALEHPVTIIFDSEE